MMTDLLRDKIYDSIRKDILKGVYKPGEQISIKQLAEKYGVSASPIRDALNALKKDRLVEVIPRMGFFVSRATLREIQETYELRIILEGASAEMAAKRITEKELQYLESLPDSYIHGDLDSYLTYLEANREFHYRVALASGNIQLANIIESLLYQMQRLVFLSTGSGQHYHEILDAHPALIKALRRGDAAEARRVMIKGIEDARAGAMEEIMGTSSPPTNQPEFFV
jgi:GntR family transcriptional regulator, rspAB operon transcriptional repressor